jgi:thiamine biosynthesis lipoprotein
MSLQVFKKECKLMGNHFELSAVASDENWASDRINEGIEEIKRIEKKLTTFNEESETNKINSMAGIAPVQVSLELYELIERSIKISSITQGAFDISYGSIDKRFWNFDTTMTELPSKNLATKSIRLINYQNIVLNHIDQTVFLAKKGMRIGFGGIGKGYAAEMAKRIMIQSGVESGIVNASGDLTTWGQQPNGKAWTIGIAHPDFQDLPFSYLNISNMAVATSGNYEKFVVIDGEKYSHTIDPKTGYPVKGIKSVTIISPNAEISDALATPVTVMGITHGLNMINQISQVECIIINDDNEVFTSNNIKISQHA